MKKFMKILFYSAVLFGCWYGCHLEYVDDVVSSMPQYEYDSVREAHPDWSDGDIASWWADKNN